MGHDSGNRLIIEVPRNGNFDVVLRLIAEALKSGGGDNTKLDAVITMLRDLAAVPAQLGLIKEELSIVHKLLADLGDLSQVQAQIDEFTKTLRASTDKVEGAINQDKGD